jgi:hypothetical protein
MSLIGLPTEVLELILRKTFMRNYNVLRLEIVCKNFKQIMNKYYDRFKAEDFVCKGCNYKPYTNSCISKCKNCPYDNFLHNKECETPKLITGGYNTVEFKRCDKCGRSCDDHAPTCKFGAIKVRGIKNFCHMCLYFGYDKNSCLNCGLEFMSISEKYCLTCLPKIKPNYRVRPEYKQILPTDEPFCY